MTLADLTPRQLRILRNRNARYQKAVRDRRKAREAEVLAMLEQMPDDAVIEITGRDYAGDS